MWGTKSGQYRRIWPALIDQSQRTYYWSIQKNIPASTKNWRHDVYSYKSTDSFNFARSGPKEPTWLSRLVKTSSMHEISITTYKAAQMATEYVSSLTQATSWNLG